MAAHQAPPSLGFSRQEHWSGLPFPSPMHESEKWKWRKWKVKVKSLSRVRLLATPWTAAYQVPPSMGFSRQEYCTYFIFFLWLLLRFFSLTVLSNLILMCLTSNFLYFVCLGLKELLGFIGFSFSLNLDIFESLVHWIFFLPHPSSSKTLVTVACIYLTAHWLSSFYPGELLFYFDDRKFSFNSLIFFSLL